MEIVRLPAFHDNYIFVLGDRLSGLAAVVDPGDGGVVLDYLRQENLQLTAILITHHHHDHVGGNRQLLAQFPNAKVYASDHDGQKGRIPGQTNILKEGDRLNVLDRTAEILFVPGHTQGHIIYYFPPTKPEGTGDLFCGDTLFAGGCGRLLEGNPAQMWRSLQRIRTLPDKTRVWCAHEYTLKNLRFATSLDIDNIQLYQRFEEVKALRQQGQATVPSLLAIEKQTNPFLRCDQPEVQAAVSHHEPQRVFAKLRGKRDLF
ncbi:hydroxyacylglutathione hydrolase [[Limnothrix rosea] IAM M-220]|uniref:hydroxyacylglutathione hydrolase n=1 Tax=[Limnothrix rosea] IAM M-220 TaxID=454133 RepID=UPI00095CF231|nr:hydroxyacylglutathione hydrolase [[Limnothrix rosea] IAM M-220]OKH12348.1 hydroxyacylglutathione hydrolase [[Limnothrix rosea] IAM M-220]